MFATPLSLGGDIVASVVVEIVSELFFDLSKVMAVMQKSNGGDKVAVFICLEALGGAFCDSVGSSVEEVQDLLSTALLGTRRAGWFFL
jgi:hypothetical protein